MKKLLLLLSIIFSINIFAGDGTVENPLTVSEAMELTGNHWVKGYVYDRCLDYTTNYFDTVINTMIVITEIKGDTTIFMPVQLSKGDARTNLNIKDNPENVGKLVQVYGSLEKYFRVPGIKGVKTEDHYQFIDVSTSIEAIEIQNENSKILENGNIFIVRDGIKYSITGIQVQ